MRLCVFCAPGSKAGDGDGGGGGGGAGGLAGQLASRTPHLLLDSSTPPPGLHASLIKVSTSQRFISFVWEVPKRGNTTNQNVKTLTRQIFPTFWTTAADAEWTGAHSNDRF